MTELSKKERCANCAPDLARGALVCKTDNSVPSDRKCEACNNYKSRYIEYPITVSSIKTNHDEYDFYEKRRGEICKLHLTNDDKVYTAVLLGELPYMTTESYNPETGKLTVTVIKNPALYVFDLKKVVYGAECWWQGLGETIKMPDISDAGQENRQA